MELDYDSASGVRVLKVNSEGDGDYFSVRFGGYKSVEEIYLYEGKYENGLSFSENTSVKKIVLPEGLETVQYKCFGSCTNLQEVELPSTIKRIEFYAFNGCRNLKKIELPEGLVSIGSNAFENCFSIKKIVFPKTLKTIDYMAFRNCTGLEEITFKGQTTVPDDWDYWFMGTPGFTDFFEGCTKLTTVYAPKSTDKEAFYVMAKGGKRTVKEIN